MSSISKTTENLKERKLIIKKCIESNKRSKKECQYRYTILESYFDSGLKQSEIADPRPTKNINKKHIKTTKDSLSSGSLSKMLNDLTFGSLKIWQTLDRRVKKSTGKTSIKSNALTSIKKMVKAIYGAENIQYPLIKSGYYLTKRYSSHSEGFVNVSLTYIKKGGVFTFLNYRCSKMVGDNIECSDSLFEAETEGYILPDPHKKECIDMIGVADITIKDEEELHSRRSFDVTRFFLIETDQRPISVFCGITTGNFLSGGKDIINRPFSSVIYMNYLGSKNELNIDMIKTDLLGNRELGETSHEEKYTGVSLSKKEEEKLIENNIHKDFNTLTTNSCPEFKL